MEAKALPKKKKVDPRKQFVAEVRAYSESLEKKYQRPYKGGYLMPERDKIYRLISKKFGVPVDALVAYFTFARYCTHPWSAGACEDCPSVDHL